MPSYRVDFIDRTNQTSRPPQSSSAPMIKKPRKWASNLPMAATWSCAWSSSSCDFLAARINLPRNRVEKTMERCADERRHGISISRRQSKKCIFGKMVSGGGPATATAPDGRMNRCIVAVITKRLRAFCSWSWSAKNQNEFAGSRSFFGENRYACILFGANHRESRRPNLASKPV